MTSLEKRLPSLGLDIDTLGVKGDDEAVELFERSKSDGSIIQLSLYWFGTAFEAPRASDKPTKLPSSKAWSEANWLFWKAKKASRSAELSISMVTQTSRNMERKFAG